MGKENVTTLNCGTELAGRLVHGPCLEDRLKYNTISSEMRLTVSVYAMISESISTNNKNAGLEEAP